MRQYTSSVLGIETTSDKTLPLSVATPSGAAAFPPLAKSSMPGVEPSDCDLSSARTAAEETGLPGASSCGQPAPLMIGISPARLVAT